VLLLAALVAPSTPAGAAGPTTLAVTPSTGLTDLDTVTITGTGFTPNSFVGSAGRAGRNTIDNCGVILSTPLSGNSGNISVTVPVHQVADGRRWAASPTAGSSARAIAAADVIGTTPVPESIVTADLVRPAPLPPATRGTITVAPTST
jgi:hypothetical protein